MSPVSIEVPARWGAEPKVPSLTVQGEDGVDPHWWRSFRDPELTSLAERVAAQNLDLKTATERVIQSVAQRQAAVSQGVPHLDGTSSDVYTRLSPNGILRT